MTVGSSGDGVVVEVFLLDHAPVGAHFGGLDKAL